MKTLSDSEASSWCSETPERVASLQQAGIPIVEGNTTSEVTLRAAQIETARGLVSCVNDDAHGTDRVH